MAVACVTILELAPVALGAAGGGDGGQRENGHEQKGSAVRSHRPELVIKIRLPDLLALIAIVVGYAFVLLPLWLKFKGMI